MNTTTTFFGFVVRDSWLERDVATFRRESDARSYVDAVRDPGLAKLVAGLRYYVRGEYVFPRI